MLLVRGAGAGTGRHVGWGVLNLGFSFRVALDTPEVASGPRGVQRIWANPPERRILREPRRPAKTTCRMHAVCSALNTSHAPFSRNPICSLNLGICRRNIADPGSGWRVAGPAGSGGAGGPATGSCRLQAEGSADPPLLYCHGTFVWSSMVLNLLTSPFDAVVGQVLRLYIFQVPF